MIASTLCKEEIFARLDYSAFWQSEAGGAPLHRGENLIHSPLTKDAHASFSINTNTGLWHDFGTGEGGDIISFVQLRYGYDFPASLEYIASRYCGSPVPRDYSPAHGKPACLRYGSKTDYRFREIVKNGLTNRGNVIECLEPPDYYHSPGSVDCSHSIYLHSREFITHIEQHQGKVAGYSRAVWLRELPFDIDFKEGSLQQKIDRALIETRKLLQKIKSFGLPFDIKFSGSKGFHTTIAPSALDRLSGYPDTPKRVENLARKISAGIEGMDSIYGHATHLIRSVNSINPKSGLYAIPLTEAEIFYLSAEKIIRLAEKPRRLQNYPIRCFSRLIGEPFVINGDGSVVFESGVTFPYSEIKMLKSETDKKAIAAIYKVKAVFGGDLERGTNGTT